MPKLFVDTDELYDVNEAAEKLGISVPTAWRWIRDEKIIVIRLGRRTLVPRSEIKRLNPSEDDGDGA